MSSDLPLDSASLQQLGWPALPEEALPEIPLLPSHDGFQLPPIPPSVYRDSSTQPTRAATLEKAQSDLALPPISQFKNTPTSSLSGIVTNKATEALSTPPPMSKAERDAIIQADWPENVAKMPKTKIPLRPRNPQLPKGASRKSSATLTKISAKDLALLKTCSPKKLERLLVRSAKAPWEIQDIATQFEAAITKGDMSTVKNMMAGAKRNTPVLIQLKFLIERSSARHRNTLDQEYNKAISPKNEKPDQRSQKVEKAQKLGFANIKNALKAKQKK
jgi:hypothetical protein